MKLIIKFFLLLFSICSFSQNSLKGKVRDSIGKPIVSANIVIKDTLNNIISYSISDANGYYEIPSFEYLGNGFLHVSHINFKNIIKELDLANSSNYTNLNFTLTKSDITSLNEIIITANRKSFSTKKDTLSYNTDAYKNESDRKIEDILKKLPGIEVNATSGEIKYKGKSIETVLLEGDDLFGYNYSLGTKNINVDIVEQVQAIENYSENPLLKGIENDDKVALTLKLKKSKIEFSGNIDLGAGLFDGKSEALDFNSNLLGITKNYKSFGTTAFNSIGINHSPFDYFGFNINLEQIKEDEFLAEKIIPETRFNKILKDDRLNINNQYFGNYNAIFRINDRLKIKTNLYYVNDEIKNTQLYRNEYIINNDIFSTEDKSIIDKEPIQYRGDIEIKYNASETSLLTYKFRIKKEFIDTQSLINTNNISYDSELNSEDFYIRQSLLYTKKLSDKKALQLSIFQSSNVIPQTFKINPSVIDLNVNFYDVQQVKNKKNYVKLHSSYLGVASSGDKYTFSFGGMLEKNELNSEILSLSEIENDITENGSNNVDYSKQKIYQTSTYDINIGKFEFSPEISFRYFFQSIEDRVTNTIYEKNNIIINPAINFRYSITKSSFLNASVDYDQNGIAQNYIFQNPVLLNNRVLESNIPSLELQKATSYGLFYFKNDMYNQLQLNFNINYETTKGNFFTNSLINSNITSIQYFYLNQNNDNLSFSSSISKYLPLVKSTVKLISNFSVSRYKNIVNESGLRDNTGQFFKSDLFFKSAFKSFFNFENIFSYSKSTFKNEDSNRFINESINNVFKVMLKPTKVWYVMLSSDYLIPNLKNNSENYMFLDATIRYRPKNKNFDFSFSGKNLLNEKRFQQTQISDFSTNIFTTNILPIYFLFNVSYSF